MVFSLLPIFSPSEITSIRTKMCGRRCCEEEAAATSHFPVTFIQHDVRQQRRSRASLRRAFIRRTYRPVLHHTRLQKRSVQAEHSLAGDTQRERLRQPMVAHPIKKLLRIEIDHPSAPAAIYCCACWTSLASGPAGSCSALRWAERQILASRSNFAGFRPCSSLSVSIKPRFRQSIFLSAEFLRSKVLHLFASPPTPRIGWRAR